MPLLLGDRRCVDVQVLALAKLKCFTVSGIELQLHDRRGPAHALYIKYCIAAVHAKDALGKIECEGHEEPLVEDAAVRKQTEKEEDKKVVRVPKDLVASALDHILSPTEDHDHREENESSRDPEVRGL